MFQNVSNRLPELWPHLTNSQKKELLRSLIRQVIIKRPVPDRLEIRIVWVSNYYSDHASCLTPVYDDQNVSGYDQKVARIEELCKQGYDDQQMDEQLTKEGFHSARSAGVTEESVEKIRLKQRWILRSALIRGADEWDGCWTVNGLAKQLGVKERASYNIMYFRKAIPAEFVLHEPNSGIYLFPKDDRLIDLLKKRLGSSGKIIKEPEEIQNRTIKTSYPMEAE